MGRSVVALGVSALLAIGLLWQPQVISALGWPWRLVMVALGAWALGAGFMVGGGLRLKSAWGQRLLGEPLCWPLLGSFTVLWLLLALSS